MMVLHSLVPHIDGYEIRLEQQSNGWLYNLFVKHLHSGIRSVRHGFELPRDDFLEKKDKLRQKIIKQACEQCLEEIDYALGILGKNTLADDISGNT
jgi:hypothetical protein